MNKFSGLLATIAMVLVVSAATADEAKWHVVTGANAYAPKCDEIGDIVFGEDNVPIYSCRVGTEWQAVKGNAKFTPKCDRMDHIWWNGQTKSVMYTCGRSVFVGNAPQPEDGGWKCISVNSLGRVCNDAYDYRWQCSLKLVHEGHRSSDGTYANVSPRRFPDGVAEVAFRWSPPAPPKPKSEQDSDVVVNEERYGGRRDSGDGVITGCALGDSCASNSVRPRQPPVSVPDGMPGADPTAIQDGRPAVVSCDNRTVTQYLSAGTKPVWLMQDAGKRRVCVDKTASKPWDDTWDLAAHDNGTASYFGKLGSAWRLVKAGTEASPFESIEWHAWFQKDGEDLRAYIATGKTGDSKPTVHFMVDGRRVGQSAKAVELVRLVGRAKAFAYAVQD